MSEQSLSDHWLTQWANASPAAEALIHRGTIWTWERLCDAVTVRAHQMRSGVTGNGPGVRRVVDDAHDPATVVELLALWSCGAAAVPVDPRTPVPVASRIQRYCSEAGDPADAVIVTTSGTTGEPKGVRLTGANMAASASAVTGRLATAGSAAWICCLPLSHVSGIAVLWRVLVTGSTAVLVAPGDTAGVAEAAAARPSAVASLVPTQLHRLLAQGHGSELDLAFVGGTACPRPLLAAAGAAGLRVARSYGMSEMASTAAVDGVPLDGVEVSIEDGEICLAGPMRSPGYAWGSTLRLTAEGALRTGDAGVFEGGRIDVSGRIDGTGQVGGENVDPGAVRDALLAHPLVATAEVVLEPDDEYGAVVAAVVGVRAGASVAEADLSAHCRGLLPPIAVPRRIEVVEDHRP